MSFETLGLSDSILNAINKKGYSKPSPIQEQAIPAVLKGRDIMASAQTGTGKTAAFTLPILEILKDGSQPKQRHVRSLIITPTRELAAQINENVEAYGKRLPLTSTVVFGGVKINPQIKRLQRGIDILIATPGRLMDLYHQKAVRFDQLEVLVLDEADRMLDMGFIHDIRKIISFLPKQRQNLLFSATFSNDIRKLAKTLVNDPVEISVTPRNTSADTVKQWICPVDKKQKSALLAQLIHDNDWQHVLVFSRTKHGADRLARQLDKAQITATAIHGNKSQNQRTRALASFKKSNVRVMVATDIAARGLDINQLPQVINFDLPNVPEDYVHRIGRTGRAGQRGQAVSLVSADEIKQLRDIERLIGKPLERRLIDGFEPDHDVPASNAKNHAKQPRKSAFKKSKNNNKKPFKNKNHKHRNSKNKSNNKRPSKKHKGNARKHDGSRTPRKLK